MLMSNFIRPLQCFSGLTYPCYEKFVHFQVNSYMYVSILVMSRVYNIRERSRQASFFETMLFLNNAIFWYFLCQSIKLNLVVNFEGIYERCSFWYNNAMMQVLNCVHAAPLICYYTYHHWINNVIEQFVYACVSRSTVNPPLNGHPLMTHNLIIADVYSSPNWAAITSVH